MLRGVFATLVSSPFAKLLFKLLGLGGGAGWYLVIASGILFLLSLVIKKFFPNVWKVFMAYWILIENKIYQLIPETIIYKKAPYC